MGQEGLDGVSIFNPDGKLIGRINLPERCANLCFGGTHRNRLFMAASTSLYSPLREHAGRDGRLSGRRADRPRRRMSVGLTSKVSSRP